MNFSTYKKGQTTPTSSLSGVKAAQISLLVVGLLPLSFKFTFCLLCHMGMGPGTLFLYPLALNVVRSGCWRDTAGMGLLQHPLHGCPGPPEQAGSTQHPPRAVLYRSASKENPLHDQFSPAGKYPRGQISSSTASSPGQRCPRHTRG